MVDIPKNGVIQDEYFEKYVCEGWLTPHEVRIFPRRLIDPSISEWKPTDFDVPEEMYKEPLHVDIQNLEPDEETQHYKLVMGIYYCKRCEVFRTGNRLALRAHLKERHGVDLGDMGYNCHVCGKVMKTERGRKIHMSKVHPEENDK